MPAILVVLGRIVLFCFGLSILVGILADYQEFKRNTVPGGVYRRDIPKAVIGGLIVVVLVAVAVIIIILAVSA